MFPHDAPCHLRTDVMFPTVTGGHQGDRPDPWQPALDLCATCLYHTECRERWEHEPADIQDHGVWFGTTPDMRRRTKSLRRTRTGSGLGRGRIHIRCHTCGTVFTGGSRSRYCPTCRRGSRGGDDPAKVANAEAQRRRRERLREQGLCTTCGRHIARARKTTCIHCARARAAARDQRRVEHGGAA